MMSAAINIASGHRPGFAPCSGQSRKIADGAAFMCMDAPCCHAVILRPPSHILVKGWLMIARARKAGEAAERFAAGANRPVCPFAEGVLALLARVH
jgi:hypothetical protein